MEDKNIITIMGPSGAGKTTIGNMIVETYDYGVPKHCTTRAKRADDQENFYRYLSHNDFKKNVDDYKYLLWSGDSEIISKENGTFYGILLEDCKMTLFEKNKIILYVSYKDIERIIFLREKFSKIGINIKILNLTYSDFSNMNDRLVSNPLRKHTPEELARRVRSAYEDEILFGTEVKKYADVRLYTDTMTVEETFDDVSKKLLLRLPNRYLN